MEKRRESKENKKSQHQDNYNSNAQTIIMGQESHKTIEEVQGTNTQSHATKHMPADLAQHLGYYDPNALSSNAGDMDYGEEEQRMSSVLPVEEEEDQGEIEIEEE